MKQFLTLFACWVPLLAALPTAAAGERTLELVPEDAGLVLAIRSLDELKERGDRFLERSKLPIKFRVSQGFEFVFGWLGIRDAVDKTKPAAAMIVAPSKEDWSKSIVVVVPFTDLEGMAGNFGADAEKLAQGKIVGGKLGHGGEALVAASRTHIYLGSHEPAIKKAMQGERLGALFERAEVDRLNGADIVLHLGAEPWQELSRDELDRFVDELSERVDEHERKVVERLDGVRESIRGITAAATIRDALELQFLMRFEDGAPGVAPFLRMLRGEGEQPSLRSLPEGDVLFAQAVRGNGKTSAAAARVLLRAVFDSLLHQESLLAAADRPVFLDVFADVWQRLEGGRVAVYRVPEQKDRGLVSTLAILDVPEPASLLAELRELCELGQGKLAKEGSDEKEDLERRIGELIQQLGHPEFLRRESATTKLMLIDQEALPQLEQAVRSDDPETRYRAKLLIRRIERSIAERRKALLSEIPAGRLRPRFVYYREAERIADTPVDVIQVRLEKLDGRFEPQLQSLLGGSWNRIRLAHVGDHVVVLFGSAEGVLEQALENLKKDAPALAQRESLRVVTDRTDTKPSAEFHISLERFLRLLRPDSAWDEKQAPQISSFALFVRRNRLELKARIPVPEIRAVSTALAK